MCQGFCFGFQNDYCYNLRALCHKELGNSELAKTDFQNAKKLRIKKS